MERLGNHTHSPHFMGSNVWSPPRFTAKTSNSAPTPSTLMRKTQGAPWKSMPTPRTLEALTSGVHLDSQTRELTLPKFVDSTFSIIHHIRKWLALVCLLQPRLTPCPSRPPSFARICSRKWFTMLQQAYLRRANIFADVASPADGLTNQSR